MTKPNDRVWGLVVLVGLFLVAITAFIWEGAQGQERDIECQGSMCWYE